MKGLTLFSIAFSWKRFAIRIVGSAKGELLDRYFPCVEQDGFCSWPEDAFGDLLYGVQISGNWSVTASHRTLSPRRTSKSFIIFQEIGSQNTSALPRQASCGQHCCCSLHIALTGSWSLRHEGPGDRPVCRSAVVPDHSLSQEPQIVFHTPNYVWFGVFGSKAAYWKKTSILESEGHGSKIRILTIMRICIWVNHLTTLNLSFYIYKMRVDKIAYSSYFVCLVC